MLRVSVGRCCPRSGQPADNGDGFTFKVDAELDPQPASNASAAGKAKIAARRADEAEKDAVITDAPLPSAERLTTERPR